MLPYYYSFYSDENLVCKHECQLLYTHRDQHRMQKKTSGYSRIYFEKMKKTLSCNIDEKVLYNCSVSIVFYCTVSLKQAEYICQLVIVHARITNIYSIFLKVNTGLHRHFFL